MPVWCDDLTNQIVQRSYYHDTTTILELTTKTHATKVVKTKKIAGVRVIPNRCSFLGVNIAPKGGYLVPKTETMF